MNLKIVTLNLWHGGTLFDEILAFLKQQQADVLILQEVYNGTDPSLERQFRSMQVLKKEFDYPFEDFVADFRDFDRAPEGNAQRGNAILSRFPIVKQDAVFLAGGYTETYHDVPGNYQNCPRNLQHVVLNTPAGEAHVFNLQGVWDLDGDAYGPDRQKMARTIIREVEGKPNVILAGDTNAKQTNQAILRIEKHLKSVFGRELTSTFNMRRKDNPGYATAAVDAIFVSPGIEVLDRDCPDVDVSDHLPLTATLRIG